MFQLFHSGQIGLAAKFKKKSLYGFIRLVYRLVEYFPALISDRNYDPTLVPIMLVLNSVYNGGSDALLWHTLLALLAFRILCMTIPYNGLIRISQYLILHF